MVDDDLLSDTASSWDFGRAIFEKIDPVKGWRATESGRLGCIHTDTDSILYSNRMMLSERMGPAPNRE
jgi:hypothetical protein